jgi:hypothetical protein
MMRNLTPPPPLILKRVSPPRGRAGVSHERKVASYHVEAAFYNECAPALSSAGLHVPTPFAIAVSDDGGGGGQGLTLLHISAQLKRFLWDRGCM